MTGAPRTDFVLPFEHPDDGGLLPFQTEALASEYVHRRLEPFCRKLTAEPDIGDGLRPDFVARLIGIPDFKLAIELKRFTAGSIWPFPEAIRQASSYANHLGTAAFVGPLAGKGASKFSWQTSTLGTALLIAGQFGVGALYFAHERYRDRPVGGLILAGVQVAHFSLNENGEPEVRLHSDAQHLLKLKLGHGSASWRS